MKNKKISIGIPTYEASEGLVVALKSVYRQTIYHEIDQIIVAVDGNKIKKNILNKIKNPKLKVIYYKKRRGQSARINSIFQNLKNEFIILTNDDVVLKKDAIEKLLKKYKKENIDLVASVTIPIKEKLLLEKVISVGVRIVNAVSLNWNKGDNYLACNGRLLGISNSLFTKLRIPEEIWNNDVYMYLYVKQNNYKFAIAENAICYYKSPENIKEHANQSLKFQKSYDEMRNYFKGNLSKYYNVPLQIKIKAVKIIFLKNPLSFILYFLLFYYTRFLNIFKKKSIIDKTYWETDKSTKKI